MNTKIREVINVLPLMQQISGVDPIICVFDKEGVLQGFCASQHIKAEFKVGYKVEDKSDKIFEVIRTGKPQYNKVPKEVWGIAFEGTITPIFDGREVVGVVTYTFPLSDTEKVKENTENLVNSVENTEKSILEITEHANELSVNMNEINVISEEVSSKLKEAIEVVATIRQNAKLSNILALNASIESARAGEAGRGFSIVATEMKKFASLSGESSERINKTLMEIVNANKRVKDSINVSSSITEKQLESVKDLNETFGKAVELADKAAKVCSKM